MLPDILAVKACSHPICTAWKVSLFEVFLVRIQSKWRKIRTGKIPNTETFHAVLLIYFRRKCIRTNSTCSSDIYISSYNWDNTVITSTAPKVTSDLESIFANKTVCTNGHDGWNVVSTLYLLQAEFFFSSLKILNNRATFPFSSFSIRCQCCPHKETGFWLADFYMRATLSLNWLKNKNNKKKTKINQFIIFLRCLRERSIYHLLPLLTSLERYYKDKLWDNSSIGNTIYLWAIRKCLCPLLVNLVLSKVWLFLPATHQNSSEHGVW